MPSFSAPFSIMRFRMFLNTRTVGLNQLFVAFCLTVQLAECCFGKFSMRVPSGKKKQMPS